MQEHRAGTWLARDGDGRILEVDAAGYPGTEASPDDGRPFAEAADPTPQQAGRGTDLLMGPPRTGKTRWPARQPEAEAGA
jgi:hypothetical protein